MRPDHLDAIIFDFDGVLVESVDVKTDAFAALYAEYGPDVVKRVVAYHQEHGGISRFQKFRYFHREFLGVELTPETEADFGRRFSEMVENAVVAAPWVIGAREFIQAYENKIPMFIASGTPDDELNRIVLRKGIQRYFVSAHGSPATKAEIIQRIVTERGLRKERVLMVGDSMTDYQGATEVGVEFIGRVTGLTNGGFPKGVTTVPDMKTLSDLLTNRIT